MYIYIYNETQKSIKTTYLQPAKTDIYEYKSKVEAMKC